MSRQGAHPITVLAAHGLSFPDTSLTGTLTTSQPYVFLFFGFLINVFFIEG